MGLALFGLRSISGVTITALSPPLPEVHPFLAESERSHASRTGRIFGSTGRGSPLSPAPTYRVSSHSSRLGSDPSTDIVFLTHASAAGELEEQVGEGEGEGEGQEAAAAMGTVLTCAPPLPSPPSPFPMKLPWRSYSCFSVWRLLAGWFHQSF